MFYSFSRFFWAKPSTNKNSTVPSSSADRGPRTPPEAEHAVLVASCDRIERVGATQDSLGEAAPELRDVGSSRFKLSGIGPIITSEELSCFQMESIAAGGRNGVKLSWRSSPALVPSRFLARRRPRGSGLRSRAAPAGAPAGGRQRCGGGCAWVPVGVFAYAA